VKKAQAGLGRKLRKMRATATGELWVWRAWPLSEFRLPAQANVRIVHAACGLRIEAQRNLFKRFCRQPRNGVATICLAAVGGPA
jgi:hypothetical protein